MDIRLVFSVFSLIYFLLICLTSGLPVTQEKTKEETIDENHVNNNEKKIESEIDDLGLEYGRYLQQVVEALETDKQFAKKLENVSQEEIKSGVIARELDFVNHNVRNKLDELKRIELDRLRQLAKKEKQLEDNQGETRRWRTLHHNIQIDAEHLDHANPHSFEAEDLQKLILSATKDLEELDAKRREDFKSYEMEKEIRYREALVNMTDEEREKTIAKHDKMQEQHKQHPKVNHPGSKKQLEQVWEQQDHMPREEFNPKIFFTMHDVNGDGFLDPQEVEAILTLEIKKMYSEKNPEDDPNEMQEEYHRMREHIYKEADINRDGLISKKEFLDFTHKMDFESNEEWKGLDEQQVYSEEDLKKFQEQQRQHQQQQYQAYQQYQQQYYPEGYHAPQQQQQQHYIPPPHQLTPEQWHQQQQYYQHLEQQMNQQYYGNPNPQLHQQIQQQQQHQQQIPQQNVQYVVQQPHPGQQIPHPQQQLGQQMVNQQQIPQLQQQMGQQIPVQQQIPQMVNQQQQQQAIPQHQNVVQNQPSVPVVVPQQVVPSVGQQAVPQH